MLMFNAENAPNYHVEFRIWFYDRDISEARCYGLYEPHMLYNPRIYVTEDGCFDIMITTIINYDSWETAPGETADYFTAYCPELLDRLASLELQKEK